MKENSDHGTNAEFAASHTFGFFSPLTAGTNGANMTALVVFSPFEPSSLFHTKGSRSQKSIPGQTTYRGRVRLMTSATSGTPYSSSVGGATLLAVAIPAGACERRRISRPCCHSGRASRAAWRDDVGAVDGPANDGCDSRDWTDCLLMVESLTGWR